MGMPPSGGMEIVTADIYVVYVRTNAGTVFGCSDHRGRKLSDAYWSEAQEPFQVDRRTTFGSKLFKGERKEPPGTVEDALDVAIYMGEDAFETRYVLLKDGTVWKWEYDTGAIWNLGILLLGPAAGVVLGIVAVVVMWARAGLRSLSRSRKWGAS